ncbi:MAG: serine/threonine protein kinase [Deltaproteobacteria bacterium]|nr:serine/threonine protein kinase [Deltaproteobacteria bacterium]
MTKTRYRLESFIGDGGMAEVYRASQLGDEGWQREVAIKRVHPHLARDPAFVQMFVREARLATRLKHSNIVAVLDFIKEADDELYLVMELVEGQDLATFITSGPIPIDVTCYVVASILSGLSHAHTADDGDGNPLWLVHRDVSPHNVLVSWHGEVKVGDFGIAKVAEETRITRTGGIKGKTAYLSPEQARAEPLDARSDLFAVGIILHEMLTGERLFALDHGSSDAAVIHRVLNHPVPDPRTRNRDVPDGVAAVSMKLLERDPSQRYPDAATALDALAATGAASLGVQQSLSRILRDRFTNSKNGSDAPWTSTGRAGTGGSTPSRPREPRIDTATISRLRPPSPRSLLSELPPAGSGGSSGTPRPPGPPLPFATNPQIASGVITPQLKKSRTAILLSLLALIVGYLAFRIDNWASTTPNTPPAPAATQTTQTTPAPAATQTTQTTPAPAATQTTQTTPAPAASAATAATHENAMLPNIRDVAPQTTDKPRESDKGLATDEPQARTSTLERVAPEPTPQRRPPRANSGPDRHPRAQDRRSLGEDDLLLFED